VTEDPPDVRVAVSSHPTALNSPSGLPLPAAVRHQAEDPALGETSLTRAGTLSRRDPSEYIDALSHGAPRSPQGLDESRPKLLDPNGFHIAVEASSNDHVVGWVQS
jgi:hypothetical protein